MKTNEFDYNLPKHLIAQHPTQKRSESKMMSINITSEEIEHKHFSDIVSILNENDVLVLNNTKVIPARLFGLKQETGAKIEVLILKIDGNICECLVRNAKAVKKSTIVVFDEQLLYGECILVKEDGIRVFNMVSKKPILEVLDKIGKIPLPPYVKEDDQDKSRYQTVYATREGSSAAPTAGLHFTNELLDVCKIKGVTIAYVTLHIGLGTFKPVEVDEIEQHVMHTEYYEIDQFNATLISNAKKNSQRIICVGTTSARVLETVANKYNDIIEDFGYSDIFIYPGYKFKAVDALITNFHLPKSTLLMMISAFAGLDLTKKAYQIAVNNDYRFFSFGDSMFLYR
jgi:S-adenosylmethionine:tRNA ribosyltransferase-isomerase